MKISEYQQLVATKIQGIDGFAGVPVLTEIKGDLVNEVEMAIAKLGLCILVLTPTMRNDEPEALAINLSADLVVQVMENPQINRGAGGTGLAAVDVAVTVAQELHYFQAGLWSTLRFEGLELVEEAQSIAYQILFNTRTALRA